MSLLNNDTQISVFVEGLDHPEGIAWGLDGYAYAGGEAGQVYRIDVDRQEVVQFAEPAASFWEWRSTRTTTSTRATPATRP